MKDKLGIKKMKSAYSSPYGRYHNPYVGTETDVSTNNNVPINSISVGHPIFGKTDVSVEEARNRMKSAAGIACKKRVKEK